MNSKVAFFAWPVEREAGTGVAGERGVGQSSSGMGVRIFEEDIKQDTTEVPRRNSKTRIYIYFVDDEHVCVCKYYIQFKCLVILTLIPQLQRNITDMKKWNKTK